jgi:PadR family transcriptional regulator, regulatory protein PadR
MPLQPSRSRKVSQPDYTDPRYWDGLIKMSLSKFFVLCVLNSRSMHGYEITKAVEAMSDGCCSPAPGTLYPVLRDFEAGGYLTCSNENVGGRQRKVYTMTNKGREAFRVAVQAWTDVGTRVAEGAAAGGTGNL